MRLFDEENYDAAALEFQRAYELAPNYRILYNLARIQRARNDYAAALHNFEQYLHDGKAEISVFRRAEVENEMLALGTRVAVLNVRMSEPGAELFLDGDLVCGGISTPCGQHAMRTRIVVNPGQRRLLAQKPGFTSATRSVVVVGADAVAVDLAMTKVATVPNGSNAGASAAPWVAWGITGALGVTGLIFGVVALNAGGDLKEQRAQFGVARSALDDSAAKASRYALVTDVLVGATLLSAGVATYLTLRAPHSEARSRAKREPQVRVSPTFGLGYAAMRGVF